MRKSLLILFSFIFLGIPVSFATETSTIGGSSTTRSYVMPFLTQTTTNTSSISQQIYLASELSSEGTPKEISKLTFYYGSKSGNSTTAPVTRKIQVWIMTTSLSAFPIVDNEQCEFLHQGADNFHQNAGTKVFDGEVTCEQVENGVVKQYDVEFQNNFLWDGKKNVVVTVFDTTAANVGQTYLRHIITSTTEPRFLHKNTSNAANFNYIRDMYGVKGDSYQSSSSEIAGHKYVNKITFTFDDGEAPTAPATPSDLSVSATTTTSATLSWSSVEGATSYDLQQSANGSDWSTLASGLTGTSYTWTGLAAESTQYARIRATNATGSSDWSSSIAVTTDAVYEYDDITFDKWSSTNSLPSSGNYYLNDDVTFTLSGDQNITLSGDMNLCLNGKTANLGVFSITVPSGKTLTIYDKVGGGKLTSFFGAQVGWLEDGSSALIKVKSGGTLVLKEGAIENSYNVDDDYFSYAIYSNGTLKISGEPVINSNDADIYLSTAGVVTLDGALTNSKKYSVKKYSGTTLTSGWGTKMSGEKPRDYFVSADNSHMVSLSGGEAVLISATMLADNEDNSSTISAKADAVSNIIIGRSFSSASFNTICLPFDLDDDQLEDIFGAGYDLREFESSELSGDELVLTFSNKVTTGLVAGKPYLLKPSIDVVNPSFEGVTIPLGVALADQTSDTYISFHGTFSPTELEGGNKNILFLGANNELFWPESTGNIKGFRAYFEVKGAAQKAARRARIVKQENTATGIETITNDQSPITNKVLRNGHLLILRDGKTYNVLGIECK